MHNPQTTSITTHQLTNSLTIMKYYDQFNNGQICAYKHALHIIQDLYKKLEDPETNGELGEISYQEQYTAHRAKRDILDKAEAKIKQQLQSVQDNNYTHDDQNE